MSIKVDENDPVGELEPSFPYRDVTIHRNMDMKELYDLEGEIGRGKFGTVYRCREKSSGLTLAAKFVGIARREDRRNVEREVEIMRMLQHPRIIQLYDAFEAKNVMCVVQELIEGGELFDRVIGDDFILTEKSCTVFVRQICEGVAFIHSKNVLHLDLKPENILCLTRTGNRIKIIDFGLARQYDPSKKLQVLFGTPEFVAPEVVNFDAIGFGTDMWSIGVICYVLLSGLSPFMGETDVETMANVTIAQYDFDDEAFDEISEEAKDFIRKLLVKERDSRYKAAECLCHPWLLRRPPLRPMGLDTTKENLRETVDRWNEREPSPTKVNIMTLPPTPPPTPVPQPEPTLPVTKVGPPPAPPEVSPSTIPPTKVPVEQKPKVVELSPAPSKISPPQKPSQQISVERKSKAETPNVPPKVSSPTIPPQKISLEQKTKKETPPVVSDITPPTISQQIQPNTKVEPPTKPLEVSSPTTIPQQISVPQKTSLVDKVKISKDLTPTEDTPKGVKNQGDLPSPNPSKQQKTEMAAVKSKEIKDTGPEDVKVSTLAWSKKTPSVKSQMSLPEGKPRGKTAKENESKDNDESKLPSKLPLKPSSSTSNTGGLFNSRIQQGGTEITITKKVLNPSPQPKISGIVLGQTHPRGSDNSSSNKEKQKTTKDTALPETKPKVITHKIIVEGKDVTDNPTTEPSKMKSKVSQPINIDNRQTLNPLLRNLQTDRFERRCSDISCFLHDIENSTDGMSIMNEIKRLSTRLFESDLMDESNNNSSSNLLRQIANRGVGPRRPKFRVTNMNRDVPIGSPPPPTNMTYFIPPNPLSPDSYSSQTHSAPQSPRITPERMPEDLSKDVVLRLFDKSEKQSDKSSIGSVANCVRSTEKQKKASSVSSK